MAQVSGTKLGPYELLSSLGAGGMGEVYRARDIRLGRHVAVKILPASFSSDASRLRRFEKEARAAASLNHPNILAVFDIGQHEGAPYIVSELLEGETLRDKLRSGPLPRRKAIDYATQLANGLAAAHERGILHRDQKPDNIFITHDNRVKILDFGLAKLMTADPETKEDDMTRTLQSDPGTVLGTVGYMSPEQVRGKAADARSDIFSFGAILYEMLTGKRAFHGESPAETMASIVHDDPPNLRELNSDIPIALERVVDHCLEKKPEDRFQSARDVAFDLETISSASGSTLSAAYTLLKSGDRRAKLRRLAAIILTLLVVAALGFFFYRWKNAGSSTSYRQLTFRRGTVLSARFSDGQVVYSARWETTKPEIFTTNSSGRGSVSTGIQNARLESVSRSGEMLMLIDVGHPGEKSALLARASSGSAPKPILEDVESADWSPDGNSIAVARSTGQIYRLEYPVGKQLYASDSGWISNVRVSPDGERVAFFEHPYAGDDAGSVAVVDRNGAKRTLTQQFSSERGLAWSPSGKEIWFTASRTGIDLDLYGVGLSGKLRTVLRVPGGLELLDANRDGRVLITQGQRRRAVMFETDSAKTQRDLVIADWTVAAALSPDASMVLLDEEAEGSEGGYTVYLRRTDGSQPIPLGQGAANDLSHDQKWALTGNQQRPQQFVLLPIGPGDPRQITNDPIVHRRGCFLSNDSQIAFIGVEPGRKARLYLQNLNGGQPHALSAEGESGMLSCSPNQNLISITGDNKTWIFSAGGSPKREVPGVGRDEYIAGWSEDKKSVFTYRPLDTPLKIYRVNMETGERSVVRELAPPETAGSEHVSHILATPDAKSYVFDIARFPNELYAIEGLK